MGSSDFRFLEELAVPGRSFHWLTPGKAPDYAIQIGDPLASPTLLYGRFIVPIMSVVRLPVGHLSSTLELEQAGFTLVKMTSGELVVPQVVLQWLLSAGELRPMGRTWSRAKLAATA